MTIIAMILHHAATRPQKPAMILPDRVVTYGMLARGIHSVGTHLAALGLRQADPVAIIMENPVRHLIVACALMRAGIPSVSFSRTSDASRADIGVSMFLEERNQAIYPGIRQTLVTDQWFSAASKDSPLRSALDPDAICRIALSSGVTGQPKPIGLTQPALEQTLRNYFVSLEGGAWERMLCLPGLTSNWGFTISMHALYAGKSLCFADTARDTLNMISVYAVDCMVASTQHLRELVEEQGYLALPSTSLRLIFTGGSILSKSLLDTARAKLCRTIICQYASTEAGAIAFAPAESLGHSSGAVGYIAPWVDAEIVDSNDNPLDIGSEGVLRIRTPSQGRPLHSPVPAQFEIRDTWFYSGDIGSISADGMLCITGRTSEIINTGGAKLAPDMVEDLLRGHTGVKDIAAFGMRNDLGVEELWVAVVPFRELEAEAILQRAGDQGIIIDRVIAIDAIPRTPLGKIAREELKTRFVV